MSDYNQGRVIRLFLGGTLDTTSERMLSRVLSEMSGVDGFSIDPEKRVLTAYVEPEVATEIDVMRAIVASGMYAHGSAGLAVPGGGEIGAC